MALDLHIYAFIHFGGFNMGSGAFNTKSYYETAAKYTSQPITSLFQQSVIFSDFNPLTIIARESCASKEHPDPTSIIIACDVTGSMGKIPEDLLKGGLGKIMESLLKISSISNPQVMFAAIGDTDFDRAPLQVTQFESDNRIEDQLKKLYLEGGGGGIGTESYHVIWYFAAHKTQLDSLKNGKKGILFTMGDEMVPDVLKADHIRKFIDKDYTGGDILTSKLLEQVLEKYEVFHLVVQDTSTYRQQLGPENVNASWKKYLGERIILVENYTEIPQKIVTTIKSVVELNLQLKNLNHEKAEVGNIGSNPVVKNGVNNNNIGLFSNKPNNNSINASAVLSKDHEGIPNLYKCPISYSVMVDPVIAEDGHTYERKSIETWLISHNTSPKTNLLIGKLLIPNHDLKGEIIEWQEKQTTDHSVSLKK